MAELQWLRNKRSGRLQPICPKCEMEMVFSYACGNGKSAFICDRIGGCGHREVVIRPDSVPGELPLFECLSDISNFEPVTESASFGAETESRVVAMLRQGMTQKDIIRKVWGFSAGGGLNYIAARDEYRAIVAKHPEIKQRTKPTKPKPVKVETTPAKAAQKIQVHSTENAYPVTQQRQVLIDYLIAKYNINEGILEHWLKFCEAYDLKWFEVNGVVLFPIPLAEKLKADNPDSPGLNFDYDYAANFAIPQKRLSIRTCFKNKGEQIPHEIQVLAEMPGTEDVYRVRGHEHIPDAWGFVLKGGSMSWDTVAVEAHKKFGKALKNCNRFHAVTFPLLFAYLARGSSAVSQDLQNLGQHAIQVAIRRDIKEQSETIPAAQLINAAPFHPQLEQISSRIVSLEQAVVDLRQNNKEVHAELQNISHGLKLFHQNIGQQIAQIESLLTAKITSWSDAERWLEQSDRIESLVSSIGLSMDGLATRIDKSINTQRNTIKDGLRRLHIQFVADRWQGHCIVAGFPIVGIDPDTGDAFILKNEKGECLGEVDHNFAVNRAGECSTWLINRDLNRKLNNASDELRNEIQPFFHAYQKALKQYQSEANAPLLKLLPTEIA